MARVVDDRDSISIGDFIQETYEYLRVIFQFYVINSSMVKLMSNFVIIAYPTVLIPMC